MATEVRLGLANRKIKVKNNNSLNMVEVSSLKGSIEEEPRWRLGCRSR
jgi:hypothetical protein